MNDRKSATSKITLRALCALALFIGAQAPMIPAQAQSRIENERALQTAIRALAVAKSRASSGPPVRVIQYGDSHTASSTAPGYFSRYLHQDFGAPSVYGGGVQLEIQAHNGEQAEYLWKLSDEAFAATLRSYQPQLIIIAYGTNEVTDGRWTFDSYKLLYRRIIARFRVASPTSSILVIGLLDRALKTGRGWASPAKVRTLHEAQRQAALEGGAAFWSACDAMGGVGSMNSWVSARLAQGDHAHLTNAGYARVSAQLYADLIAAYNGFWRGTNTLVTAHGLLRNK